MKVKMRMKPVGWLLFLFHFEKLIATEKVGMLTNDGILGRLGAVFTL